MILNMPINVFGNSSNNSGNKIDTSLFAQKSYIRTNYLENNIEEDIDLKNQYGIKNLPNPNNDKDAGNKIYIDGELADIIKKYIQYDDFISFLDNDYVEYKLKRYKELKILTDISLFQFANKENNINTKWDYEI